MSSAVSADEDEEIASLHRKRKRDPSIHLSNKRNVDRKFLGTHTKIDERGQPDNARRVYHNPTPAVDADIEDNTNSVKSHYKPGTSRSAQASRKLREKANDGTYIVHTKKLETWKTKIRGIDPDVGFDDSDPRRVLHTRCTQWVLVKEPGDTTRFKEHIRACLAKPVPVGGTLMGMGWLKVVENTKGKKENIERKLTMPCRGVAELDNPLIDQYLNRTGAGGGGARSIHLISEERFNTEYKYLTKDQKDEVCTTQRLGWAWRNDHLSLRVYATNCRGFTSSHSLTTSLCPECKSLLDLKVFTVAIRKKIPLDENAKYINTRYINPALVRLYEKFEGLKKIVEQPVSDTLLLLLHFIRHD